jgi:hypothetical protein
MMLALRLAVLSLSLYAAACASTSPGMHIRYTTTVGDDRYPTVLDIPHAGEARLQVGTNRARRDRAVGLFEAPLSEVRAAAARAAVADPGFAAATDQAELVPDESFREITVGAAPAAGAIAVTKLVGERVVPSPSFARAEAAMLAAIEELYAAPRLALTVSLELAQDRVPVGGAVALNVVLTNVGTQALTLRRPPPWGGAPGSVSLSALRADKPASELALADQVFVTMGSEHWQPPPGESGAALRLAPGAAWQARLVLRPSWTPGLYRVDLAIELSFVDDAGRTPVAASLLTPTRLLRLLS